MCKRVAVLSLCPVCNIENETVLHILVKCPLARMCWNQIEIAVNDRECTMFSQWFKSGYGDIYDEGGTSSVYVVPGIVEKQECNSVAPERRGI